MSKASNPYGDGTASMKIADIIEANLWKKYCLFHITTTLTM
jgi:UDP-N-acetylglucosamine 2-epimerase